MMNDIKSDERSSLGAARLRHLMLWHVHGKEIKPEMLDVRAILKRWKEADPDLLRRTHHAFPAPAYPWQAGSSSNDSGTALVTAPNLAD